MAQERPLDWHPQDWAIVIEALAQWAGPPEKTDNHREDRAWELIEFIAAVQGIAPDEIILQIDEGWSGPN